MLIIVLGPAMKSKRNDYNTRLYLRGDDGLFDILNQTLAIIRLIEPRMS